MKLEEVEIENFRAIEHVRIPFDNKVNVIVGPNAVGKTTVLEAIRLCKGVLSPRTPSESQQVLISTGAVSPHLPQQINLHAVSRDADKKVAITCNFRLSPDEISAIQAGVPQIALQIVQSEIGQAFANQGQLIGFLNSPDGINRLNTAQAAVSQELSNLQTKGRLCVGLVIDPALGRLGSVTPLDQYFLSYLEQRLNPYETLFSYFPADRALPTGDPGIQIGGGDIGNQLESHNSQPQLKYSRLKNTIFNTQVMGIDQKNQLEAAFNSIFEQIFKDKMLNTIGVNAYGLVSIEIKDKKSGRIFDIDRLSSGEKGLILTFVTIARSTATGGVIMLDEPELHLNPAVCKQVLDYIVDNFSNKKDAQFVICSHSAEILSGTLGREECSLFHLVSERRATKVRLKDQGELVEAFRRLGSSEADALLYVGNVYVEGIDDEEILRAGFADQLKRFKIRDLGGRKEIEKNIKKIQAAETEGQDVGRHLFVFDLDDRPTSLSDSTAVKVIQWDRTNLENYLIDSEAILDAINANGPAGHPIKNIGEVDDLLRKLAFEQIEEVAAKRVYRDMKHGSTDYDADDFKQPTLLDTASSLFDRLADTRRRIGDGSKEEWTKKYLDLVRAKTEEIKTDWSIDWPKHCDGKKLLKDLQATLRLRTNLRQLKGKLMNSMREGNRPNWLELKSKITNALT